MELKKASEIADNLVNLLSPHCEKIDVAGSVRRKKSEVKDIEIVCLPKNEVLKDIFGWDEGIIRTFDFEKNVNAIGKIVIGKIDGKYMAIDLRNGIMLDLFMPDAHDYYRELAIRTGSADYSWKVIAASWKRIGWCDSDEGLRKITDCVQIECALAVFRWKCVVKNATLPPVWKSEKEFFDWINVKMVAPCERL